jgi:predicted metalloprotease with PDZ domain
MKQIFILVQFVFFSALSFSQHYQVSIDLTDVKDDKVPVNIDFVGFDFAESVEFQMPKIVPGTYSISDFGKAISNLKAFDKTGGELTVTRIDDNRWSIVSATALAGVKYDVDDTFDSREMSYVFEPGGTNIQADTNFVINTFGFIGYIENLSKYPFEIKIKHPDFLFGASPMKRKIISPVEETFFADNYFQMSDSPIMYSAPDTASVMIGNTRVMVSVYSPGKKTDASSVMEIVAPTLTGAGEFLGGELPVDDYLIMIYLVNSPTGSGGYGALEHSYSTVFVLPDVNPKYLSETLVDVTAHEFFHIITPLTIHSEQIGDYDFINPVMSKHLWLYEGVTEYSSIHMQVMYGLVTPDEFLEVINDKLDESSYYYNDLPFTEMSLGALDKYEDEYTNVYEKGALIGMCLDLKLLELSNGQLGVRELLQKLSEIYGIERSFLDEDLFDEIADLTYSEIRDFFARYVEGPEPLPYAECLGYAGIDYNASGVTSTNTLGNVEMEIDGEANLLIVTGVDGTNAFGRQMGYRVGDLFISINGMPVNAENFSEVYTNFLAMDEGEKITIVVSRKNKKGIEKEKKLKGKITVIKGVTGGSVEWNPNPTEHQLLIRNIWLNQ